MKIEITNNGTINMVNIEDNSAEKAKDHLMELDNKVVDEGEYYFSVYQEGFWSEDRYEIEIIEKVVL